MRRWCRRHISGLTLAALGLLVAVWVVSGWVFANLAIGNRTRLDATLAFGRVNLELTTVTARAEGSILPRLSTGWNPEVGRSGHPQWSLEFGYGWRWQMTPTGVDADRWLNFPVLVLAPLVAVPWLWSVCARRRARRRTQPA